MEAVKRTVVGNFKSLNEARSAVAEIRNAGYMNVKLVENDADTDYSASSSESTTYNRGEREGGISGFFSRLFGFDDEQPRRSLSSDTENYFRGAYQNKHHLVIVRDAVEPQRCVDIIRSFDGQVEEEGSQYFDREYSREDSRLASADNEQVLELREEQLEVNKERVQSGEVIVRKELVTEMKTVQVPVTREEIVVERRSLDGIAHEGSLSTAELGRSEEIRIPVSEEHIHVEKKVVPVEEVRVSKKRTTETETVSEEVRHEEARIESEGRVSMKTSEELARKKAVKRRDNDLGQPSI